ncbi:hypothetical protein FACS189459_0590 [Bacilli bacterium]|nr:hypothetical protein FACS189459_0590 [Bacilli bacterium]
MLIITVHILLKNIETNILINPKISTKTKVEIKTESIKLMIIFEFTSNANVTEQIAEEQIEKTIDTIMKAIALQKTILNLNIGLVEIINSLPLSR